MSKFNLKPVFILVLLLLDLTIAKSQYLIIGVDVNTSVSSSFTVEEESYISRNGNSYLLSTLEDGSNGKTKATELFSIRMMTHIGSNIFFNLNFSSVTVEESYFGVLYNQKIFNGSQYVIEQAYDEVKIKNEYAGIGFELMYKFGKQLNSPFITTEAKVHFNNISEYFSAWSLEEDKSNSEFSGWLYPSGTNWRFNLGAGYRFRNFMVYSKYWLPFVPNGEKLGVSNYRIDLGLTFIARSMPFRKKNKLYIAE